MLASLHRLVAVTLLGFASGLPLALTGQALQTWLATQGIDIAAIGFLTLVGLPYTFKFLWAPIMDRVDVAPLSWFGRRRGWMVLMQVLLGAALAWLGSLTPSGSLLLMGWVALLVAFLSATQDVALDAYTTELLASQERGLGASLKVMGYRLAMVVSGGLALIWTDPQQGGLSWPEVYRGMAWAMLAMAVVSAVALPRLIAANVDDRAAPATSSVWIDVRGLLVVLAVAALGYLLTQAALTPAAHELVRLMSAGTLTPLAGRWADLLALLLGLALTLPTAAWVAKRVRFDTLLGGVGDFLRQPGAVAFLALVVLYKLGDAFALSLQTPFLLTGMGYASAEVGVANKIVGLWMTIVGALAGGAVMWRLGLWRSLMAFGVLQMASNVGFAWLAVRGAHLGPQWLLPAFDIGIVKLAQATPIDPALLGVVTLDNLAGGMGTAAFLALLMSLTHQRYTATQFALLSALASVGRVWVGPVAGVLAATVGWPLFFAVSTLAALPALWLLMVLRRAIAALSENAD